MDNNEDRYAREALLMGFTYKSRVKGVGVYCCPVCNNDFNYQISAMRSLYSQGNKVNCPSCINNELNKIQDDLGIYDLAPAGPGQYTFKYVACGHSKKQTLVSLRNGDLKTCLACVQETYNAEAKDQGLLFLGPTNNGTYNYQFISCGHKREMSPNSVRKGSFKCLECCQDKLEAAADKAGMVYVGKSDKGAHYRSCYFKDCGHHKDVQVYNLTGRSVVQKCLTCSDIKHKTEAKNAGLTLLGKADCDNANYRRYKTTCCDTAQDFEVTHIRRNNWVCHSCNSTYFTKPNNLYLLKIKADNRSWLKLGFSKDVDSRITGYGLTDNADVEVLKVVEIPTGKETSKIEKSLHKKYKKLRISPESMKVFFLNSGFTECYPLELLDMLLSELMDVENNAAS